MDSSNTSDTKFALQATRVLQYGLGGPVIAADTIWKQKSNIAKGALGLGFIFLLPVLFLCMLPSFIFGGLNASDIWNDQSVAMRNLQEYQMAVWSALDNVHDDLLADIQSKIESLGENERIIISDDFRYSAVKAILLLSQYCVAKGIEEISAEDITNIIQKHGNELFTYDIDISEDDEIIVYTYTVSYVGDNYFADEIWRLDEKQKQMALDYASNLQIFLYGSNLGGVSAQVNEDVLAYGELVAKYAEKYGIGQFIAVINAVMMAESGGGVPDVMQASECPYNTKYPQKPNGITEPEYSIDVGIHYLADCLNSAGCTSPSQTDKLSLALQGYNFGNGYISWALEKYGGYSESNAAEFSKIMKEKLGWNSYGNPKYVRAVFQYLVFTGSGVWGSPFVGKDWSSVVSSEFGYRTDPINGSSAFHEGLDIAYPSGTPINAVSGGIVTSVVYSETGYGYHIRVDCGDGVTVLYAHCSKIFVTKGQSIAAGQVIAEVGATGRVTGAHLHLGVLVNGEEVNPRDYIAQ